MSDSNIQASDNASINNPYPNTPDELYVYLWSLHSAIRTTYLMSATITLMALKKDAEVVHNLGLLIEMSEYQRSLITEEELLQRLDKTLREVHPELYQEEPEKQKKQKVGLITKIVAWLRGADYE